MTPQEAKAHAHLFECAEPRLRAGGKIVDLVATLQEALSRAWSIMHKRDPNEEAVGNVEHATDSERVSGEELLESEELKRQLREAKQKPKEPESDS